MLSRLLALPALTALAASCGPEMEASIAPPREIGAWCDFHGSRLGLEPGVVANPLTCDAAAVILSQYLDAYESRWQKVPTLPEWTIRVVADFPTQGAKPGSFFAGQTFWASKTIDIYQGSLSVLPHEVHHVALGPSSYGHQGWCPFGDWEAEQGILEELDYLGCPPPAK
jgi:hypothetical protein